MMVQGTWLVSIKVQLLSSSIYPMDLYFHYATHALNLCVVAACSVQSIRNMHGTLQEFSIFYNSSPKRQGELE